MRSKPNRFCVAYVERGENCPAKALPSSPWCADHNQKPSKRSASRVTDTERDAARWRLFVRLIKRFMREEAKRAR